MVQRKAKSKDLTTEDATVGTTEVTEIRSLFGVGVVGAGYADAVVGEVVVHFGDIHFGHVARDAVLRADGAGHARVIGSFFPGGGSNVAT